ncbi:hypothetical protein N9Z15_05765 [Akkermansiaceae bacterium]|nr:hypothetical protein [Akkermansiaceae bacterium]MDB4387690.1 hypothetical protein [Akkermansiaceae bacterium]
MNKYISNAKDLQTTYEETKLGFMGIALRKSKEASHYVVLGKAFRAVLERYEDPNDLVNAENISVGMCDAAGVSTKARGYLNSDDIKVLLADFIEQYIIPVGASYVDELISRYMLTQGDALGGRMRNIVGGIAAEKLTNNIISLLNVRGYEFSYFNKKSKSWIAGGKFSDNESSSVKAISWKRGDVSRLLYYDLTVPVVKKNIDIVIFNNDDVDNTKTAEFRKFIQNPSNYLALGELKGGIDPAGADEHWKTANTALNRIRNSFDAAGHHVSTLFIGAAIEAAMAEEIYNQCVEGKMTICANLTKDPQFLELCDWIVTT